MYILKAIVITILFIIIAIKLIVPLLDSLFNIGKYYREYLRDRDMRKYEKAEKKRINLTINQ